jgi:hypothetical protein
MVLTKRENPVLIDDEKSDTFCFSSALLDLTIMTERPFCSPTRISWNDYWNDSTKN